MKIDPISLEIIRNALATIADEMALVIMRSGYSPVVRDSMDYSTALCDKDGHIVAQGLTLAVQLGSFPDIMRIIVRDFAADLAPGDVLIANDPYSAGGQHLPDIYIIKPLFHGERLCGYATTMAHHCDVGGITPGSVAIHAREIYQEGLCLPLVKLYELGRANDAIFKIIERNTRQPIHLIGDIKAQIASCEAGERGYLALVKKFGLESFHLYLDALQSDAETRMRAAIAGLPDGVYKNTDYIDGVGEDPNPLPICVTITISGDEIQLDFAGTANQIEAGINCPIAMVHSSAYCAIRCLVREDIPNCEGYMRPIRISAPLGSIVNPRPPAACGARGALGYRVFDTIMGALAKGKPHDVIAGCDGGPLLFAVGGRHQGRQFVLTEVLVGTWGARAGKDGLDGVSNPAANLSNQPVELIEATLPLAVNAYGLVPDSGGTGEFRGGLAFIREYEFLSETAEFTIRSDRRRHRPYGVAGGGLGAPSSQILTANGDSRELPTMPMQSFRVKRGDVFRLVSPGGGGFGDPLKRDPNAVLADIQEGRVSRSAAEKDYGVVLEPAGEAVDRAATEALRTCRRSGAVVAVEAAQ
jgi:N-methylhydantoinase B